jgi:hypothetical protein
MTGITGCGLDVLAMFQKDINSKSAGICGSGVDEGGLYSPFGRTGRTSVLRLD